MPANSIRHDHHEAAIIHVQPIASPNKLILSIPRERAIGFRTKIGFVKSGHEQQLHKRPIKRTFEWHLDPTCGFFVISRQNASAYGELTSMASHTHAKAIMTRFRR